MRAQNFMLQRTILLDATAMRAYTGHSAVQHTSAGHRDLTRADLSQGSRIRTATQDFTRSPAYEDVIAYHKQQSRGAGPGQHLSSQGAQEISKDTCARPGAYAIRRHRASGRAAREVAAGCVQLKCRDGKAGSRSSSRPRPAQRTRCQLATEALRPGQGPDGRRGRNLTKAA